MAKQRFLNNFDTQFIAAVKSAPTSGTPATELDYGILRVATGAAGALGALTNGDWYILTGFKQAGTVQTNLEIMKVTAINTSVINEVRLTVLRGQEGTTPQSYVSGDYLSMRETAGTMDNMVQTPQLGLFLPVTGGSASGLSVDGLNGGPLAGMRNGIINGDMRVARRGTSFSLSATPTYTLDRWCAYYAAGSSAATASQVASGISDSPYALKIQRSAGSTNTNAHVVAQALESLNSTRFAGKAVTLSFKAKAGANYSNAGSGLNLALVTGTGIDQAVTGVYGGGWSGWASPINTAKTLTTSWQTFSLSATLASTTTQLGLVFWMLPVGTAGADDSFFIDDVQIEVGGVATPFEVRPYSVEEAICQRFLPAVVGVAPAGFGMATTTSAGTVLVNHQVPPRVAPTGVYVSNYAAFTLTNASGSTSTPTSIAFSQGGTTGTVLSIGASATLVAGAPLLLAGNTSGAQILFTGCEL